MKHTNYTYCPHCGNTDAETIQSNGLSGHNESFLCVHPCEPEDSSFDEFAAPDPKDRRVCGMQWDAE